MKVLKTEDNPEGLEVDQVIGDLLRDFKLQFIELKSIIPADSGEGAVLRKKLFTNEKQITLLELLDTEQKKLNARLKGE